MKTWHWILIAAVVGGVIGAAQTHYRQPIHGNYIQGFGYFLGDQTRFENALTAEIDGQRRFRDITVYVRQIQTPPSPGPSTSSKASTTPARCNPAQGRSLGDGSRLFHRVGSRTSR